MEINIIILITLITVSQENLTWILVDSEPIFFIISDSLVTLGSWSRIHPRVGASAKSKHALNATGMNLQLCSLHSPSAK